jgi:Outer membrane protein beta-barrel domain
MDIGNVACDSAAQFIKPSTNNGLIAGGQLDVWFNDHVALSTSLLLDQKGWSLEFDNPGNYNNYTLDYIEIPLFLKVAFGTGNFQPYVFAGPSIGFMVLGYTNQFQSDGRNTFNNIFNINNLLNTIDFSVVGGAGVAYNLPSGTQICVDAGYAYGLVNILNEKGVNSDPNSYAFLGYGPLLGYGSMPDVYKTRDIRIAGGIMFPI